MVDTMIATDLRINRSGLQGSFGQRFFARRSPLDNPTLVADLLTQVCTIPTGFPGCGKAAFSLNEGPNFGEQDNMRGNVACLMRGMLG